MKRSIPAALIIAAVMLSLAPIQAGAAASPWYVARFEGLGFHVFEPAFSFQDFKVSTLAGGSKTRSSSKGNIILLNFWATWCPPCKDEIPSIDALSKTMKGKAFEVFAVNLGDSAETVKSFVSEWKIGFPVYLDPKNLLSRTYASQGIPTTYVLDKQGRFIAGMVGSYDYSNPEFVALMTELAAR